jgi:hypothetical protein
MKPAPRRVSTARAYWHWRTFRKGRRTQVLWGGARKVQAEAGQTLLMRRRQQREGRAWREEGRLRKLVPDANALTLDLAARISAARGLGTRSTRAWLVLPIGVLR